jgi:thymidylate synthase
MLLNSRRRISISYACAELLWILSGEKAIKRIVAYAPQYKKFSDDGKTAHGAYGYRLLYNWRMDVSQLKAIVDILKRFPESRQAIVTLWTANADLLHAVNNDSTDLPCTLSFQFLIRDKRLHMITTMRSNDAWLGLPYDVFVFTMIQMLLAYALDVDLGTYTHQVGSMHLYEKHWDAAREAVSRAPALMCDHNWKREKTDIFKAIEDACASEAEIRTAGTPVKMVDLPSILRDCVWACASKWIDVSKHGFHSQILRYAYVNNRRD